MPWLAAYAVGFLNALLLAPLILGWWVRRRSRRSFDGYTIWREYADEDTGHIWGSLHAYRVLYPLAERTNRRTGRVSTEPLRVLIPGALERYIRERGDSDGAHAVAEGDHPSPP